MLSLSPFDYSLGDICTVVCCKLLFFKIHILIKRKIRKAEAEDLIEVVQYVSLVLVLKE